MSRSYKKEPISKDNQRGGAKWGKRMAASRIRNIDPESEEAEYWLVSPIVIRK